MKTAPIDVHKQHERCRSLLKEMDELEESLRNLAAVISNQHAEFNVDLKNSIKELQSIELMRQEFLKDALLRNCQANFGMFEYIDQVLESMKQSINNLAQEKDKEGFDILFEIALKSFVLEDNSIVKSLGISTDLSASMSLPPAMNSDDVALDSSGMRTPSSDVNSSNIVKKCLYSLDQIRTCLDVLKTLCIKSHTSFAEMGDAQKHYGKSALKTFEKHGYAKSLSTASTAASLLKQEIKCADLVVKYESPMCRLGWNAVVQSVEKFAEAHFTSSEIILEKACVTLDGLFKKIEQTRKEISDKITLITKRIDGAKSAEIKVSAKLAKVKRDLKDRRTNTIPKTKPAIAKEDSVAENEGSSTHHFADVVDVCKPEESNGTDNTVAPATSEIATVGAIAASRISFTALGAVSAFGAAVGLESSERNLQRISALEDEERAYVEQLISARASIGLIYDESISDLNSFISTMKSILSKYLIDISSAYRLISDANTVAFNISKGAIEHAFSEAQNIDTTSDLKFFIQQIITSANGGAEDKTGATNKAIQIPAMVTFSVIQNDVIEVERVNERETTKNEQNKMPTPLKVINRPASTSNASGDNNEHDGDAEGDGAVATHVAHANRDTPLWSDDEEDFSKKIQKKVVIEVDSVTLRDDMSRNGSEDKDNAVTASSNRTPPTPSRENTASLISEEGNSTAVSSNVATPGPAVSVALPKEDIAPELAKFGISSSEKILEYFSCALYPKRGLLTHGRFLIYTYFTYMFVHADLSTFLLV